MQLTLLKKANIEKREGGFSLLIFLTGFLLGFFLGSFDVVAHAIFFEEWTQADIPMVYLFSGGLGILVFALYGLLHKRMPFKAFYFLNSFLCVALTLVYFGFYLFSKNEVISFGGLVLMFPLNLLLLLNYWRHKRKMLYPEQTRRIFPLIEVGIVLGISISAWTYFMLAKTFDYQILVLYSIVPLLLLFILQIPVNLTHKRSRVFNTKPEKRVPVRSSLFILWSTKFTRSLILFAVFSSVIAFYLHYGLINLFKIKFPDVADFSVYYFLFIFLTFFFILITDKLLIRKILYSYDSPYSLALLPVGLIIALLFTIGGTLVLRRIDHANPLPFLLLLAITKGVYEIGKNTLQLPSMRTLYRTLDIRFLQLIYPRIEGAMVMLGLLLSGGFIILTQTLISSILMFVTMGVVLSLVWLYFTFRLVKQYKVALQDSYRKLRISRSEAYRSKSYDEKLRKILVGDNPVKVINAMKLSARIEPLSYERGLQRMLANPEPAIQQYVFECIRKETLIDLLPELKKINPASNESADLLKTVIRDFESRQKLMKNGTDLETLVSSRSVRDRVLAAEIIGARRDPTYTSYLVNLSREFEPDVKIAAVKAMARMSNSDHSYLLIEYLTSPDYHAFAFEALVQIGDPALDYLERLFINPNTSDIILTRVVRIYGKVGTPKAVELLLSKLENQSKKVTMATIAALHESNFQASSLNVHRILNIVVRTIHVLGWNFLAYSTLPEKPLYTELRNSFLNEIEDGYDLLFDLLSLAYNARTIYEIRRLLSDGSSAEVSHAIEMLDHFVYEDIKPVLFPVIENIKIKDRVRRLQYYFPIESMSEEELISYSLVRDYNLLSLYPRICAMQLAVSIPEFEINQELIANLFHPNRLLREVAAMVIYQKDPKIFEDVIDRLDPDVRFEIEELLTNLEKQERLLLIEKYNLLLKTEKLAEMPEDILIEFAESFREIRYKAGQSVNLQQHQGENALFFMVEGAMQLESETGDTQQAEANELFYSSIFINAGINKLTFNEDTLILAIDDEAIETLLFDHSEIANCVLSCVEQFKQAG